MLKRRSFISFTALALVALFTATAGYAIEFQSLGDFTVKSDEVIGNEQWLLADSAKVDGVVENDLFLLTQNAVFTGRFRYDLWCIGDTIDFRGYVQEHARLAAAKTVQISGRIDLNLISMAGTVMVNENAVIGGDVLLLGEHVILEGAVGGRARLIGREVTLGGQMNGDVRLIADDIVILPGTVVAGDIRYTSPKELILDSRVGLQGSLIRETPEAAESGEDQATPFARRLMVQVYFFLGALLAGIVWLSIFRAGTARAVNHIRRSTWRCMLAGLIAFCMIPMLSLFALFTLVGIPLGLIAGTTYLVLLYMAKIITGIAIGSIILRQFGTQSLPQAFGAMTAGLAVLYLLAAVPIFSSALWFASTIIGLGAIVLSVMMPAEPSVPPPLRQEHTPGPSSEGAPDSE